MILTVLISALLALSLILNSYLLIKVRARKARQESYEVINLLHDLTAGKGLIEIKRIAPVDVFMRSPRGNQ